METLKRFIGTKLKLDDKNITILSFDFVKEKVHIHWSESNKRTYRDIKSILKKLDLTQEEKEYYNISFFSKKEKKDKNEKNQID